MFEIARIVTNTKSLFSRFSADRRAVTAMEYGLIAALVAVVIIGGLTTLGSKLTGLFTQISSSL